MEMLSEFKCCGSCRLAREENETFKKNYRFLIGYDGDNSLLADVVVTVRDHDMFAYVYKFGNAYPCGYVQGTKTTFPISEELSILLQRKAKMIARENLRKEQNRN